MADNKDVLAPLLAKREVEIDLGDYDPTMKGQMVRCHVNAPAIVEAYLQKNAETKDYAIERHAVAILFGLEAAFVHAMDDRLMLWLFVEGGKAYNHFHEQLGEKSAAPSAAISIPSTPTAQP